MGMPGARVDRSIVRAAGVAALLAALTMSAACGSTTEAAPGGAPSDTAPSDTAPSPDLLLGAWDLEGPDGTAIPTTWIPPRGAQRAGVLTLESSCGDAEGQWIALPGRVAATVQMWPSECAEPPAAWLERVSAFTPDGGDLRLEDASGSTVAVLRAARGPAASPGSSVSSPSTPPAALSAALRAPSTAELLGTWVQEGINVTSTSVVAHARFAADARWWGSDGCNGGRGMWLLGQDGRLLVTSGARTLIACAIVGDDVTSALEQAVRVGLDGATLVLLDETAAELARLVRAPAGWTPPAR